MGWTVGGAGILQAASSLPLCSQQSLLGTKGTLSLLSFLTEDGVFLY